MAKVNDEIRIKTGLVFIGGEGPSADFCSSLAERADITGAADSGLIAAEAAGVRPDFIAGDMDSLDENRLLKYPKESVFKFPVDKDLTDTEIAINILRERGCGSIILAGGGGGRLSHLFEIKNIFERVDYVTEWYPGDEKIFLLKAGAALSFCVQAGDFISVFPIGAPPFKARSRNLKWPLDEVKGSQWENGFAGISNVFHSRSSPPNEIFIQSISGKFLIILEGSGTASHCYGQQCNSLPIM